jgi:hypothetical protein
MNELPLFARVRQNFPAARPIDIRATLTKEFGRLSIPAGATIAVGVGSRGIANLAGIVRIAIDLLRSAGAKPFIFPAMGSHGGATPEGQCGLLAGYGVDEAAMGVPIRASLEVREVGRTADGVPVFGNIDAMGADGILLINRVKPHTDFFSRTLGSGLLKMAVVGLGKQAGAAAMHLAASQHGHEHAIRTMARVLIEKTPLLGGLAILENQFHETAGLTVLRRDEIERREGELLAEAWRLMPLLPFDEIDLLVVDRIGKNISGTGMDPNVVQRSIDGYSTSLQREGRAAPFIKRIFVRDLTEETHGNALGIGLADATTTRVVRAMDVRTTAINSLTALTMNSAKVPIHFDSDREALERMLASLPLKSGGDARVVRIRDTLSLEEMQVSAAMLTSLPSTVTPLQAPERLGFDRDGNISDEL